MPPRRHLSGDFEESASGADPPAPGRPVGPVGGDGGDAAAPVDRPAPRAALHVSDPPSMAAVPLPSPADLEAMKYKDLQKLAKTLGVKANLARAQLMKKILEANMPEEGERWRNKRRVEF